MTDSSSLWSPYGHNSRDQRGLRVGLWLNDKGDVTMTRMQFVVPRCDEAMDRRADEAMSAYYAKQPKRKL